MKDRLSEKYQEAYRFATERHSGQMRKTAPIPYIVHIYEVTQILREENADEETLIGAILHDTVEDTGTSLQEIREKFGDRVAVLVDYVSENKKLPYVERKREHNQRLAHAPIRAKMIKCADCLSNLRSLYLDIKYYGNPWKCFNSSKENIMVHYYNSIKAFSELKNTKMYKALVGYFKKTFLQEATESRDRVSDLDRDEDENY